MTPLPDPPCDAVLAHRTDRWTWVDLDSSEPTDLLVLRDHWREVNMLSRRSEHRMCLAVAGDTRGWFELGTAHDRSVSAVVTSSREGGELHSLTSCSAGVDSAGLGAT